jgi:hypothetical protein
MAAITFYLKNVLVNSSLSLQDGGGAPSAGITSTGWVVSKSSSPNSSLMQINSRRGNASFTAADSLTPPNLTTSSSWRSENPYTGTFAATPWTLAFRLRAALASGGQTGSVCCRIWKSTSNNAAAGTFTELTTSVLTGTDSGAVSITASGESDVTFTPSSPITFNNEYLYVQCEWSINTTSTSTSADIEFYIEPAAVITTSDFGTGVGNTYNDAVNEAGAATDALGSVNNVWAPGISESASVSDASSVALHATGVMTESGFSADAVTGSIINAGVSDVVENAVASDALGVSSKSSSALIESGIGAGAITGVVLYAATTIEAASAVDSSLWAESYPVSSVEAASADDVVSGTIISVSQSSYTLNARDAIFNVIVADPYFSDFTLRKMKMNPVQPDLLPYLGVYIVEEQMTPDGDANAGCIRFSHSSRIGLSAILENNDFDELELELDATYQRIMSLLWTDPKLMNVLVNDNPYGVGIESLPRGMRRHTFGSAGLNNETPFGELQYEVSCFYRSEWYPDITDTLDEIDVTTGIKAGDTQAEMDQRQQVSIKYMFDVLREARRS